MFFFNLNMFILSLLGSVRLAPLVEGGQISNRSPLEVPNTQSNSESRLSQITKSSEVTGSRSPQVIPRRKMKWVKWIKVAPSKAKGEY